MSTGRPARIRSSRVSLKFAVTQTSWGTNIVMLCPLEVCAFRTRELGDPPGDRCGDDRI
jgi:hypothetical protein